MSKTLTYSELAHACKRIFKPYSPFSFSILDSNHEANIDYVQNIFLLAEQVNLAFSSGELETYHKECSIVEKSSNLGQKKTFYLRPVLTYGKVPFILQRLDEQPYMMSFEIAENEEQYCPRHINAVIKEMAINAAKKDNFSFKVSDATSELIQELEKGENPHEIPKIRNAKTHTFIINVKDNIMWTKQESNLNRLPHTFLKLLQKIVRSFGETDYHSKTRLQNAHDTMNVTQAINIKKYTDYSSVDMAQTAGVFRVHGLMEHLADCEEDVTAIDVTCTAQLVDNTDTSQKTSFKDSLDTFVYNQAAPTSNKFDALIKFSEEKNLEVSEARLQVSLDADETLYGYIENWSPNYLSDHSLSNTLSAECKVAARDGNMKIELTNSDEFKTFMQGLLAGYQEHEASETVSLTRAEAICVDHVGDAIGMLLGCLDLYIKLLHKINKRDEDFGKIAERYERQRVGE